MGKLFIVSTPIGNLGDITLRALETLKKVDLILAEDTRVTKKLLYNYNIQKPILSYHKYSKAGIYDKVYKLILEDKNLALVSDSGTPGICDPGPDLIQFLISKNKNIQIIPIPGPAALSAALSVSGLDGSHFTFLGYPPHKKGREKFFNSLKEIKIWPIILYESPHRILKTFDFLEKVFGPSFNLIVFRELTKIYEEKWQGNILEAKNYFQDNHLKGEFVLILKG
ncbi:MAG: 16S rRNA (cytidine(1402)-2'-O)-methyltransferase [Minisyncoccia bacterium]